jgi:hypothetical protein
MHEKNTSLLIILFAKKVASNEALLSYVQSEENLADIFTKPPNRSKFEYFKAKLGFGKY